MGTRFVSLIVVCALLVGGVWLAMGGAGFHWVRGVEQSKGPFFRVDVKLKYKGEPLDISFEVACSARITSYADNSQSYEVGLTPNLYGRRMKDNQAVVVRPPTACHGETTGPYPDPNTNDRVGDIPPGFMPIIVVYENADTLAFGRAYLGDDAYEGPKSELTFLGATVTKSNFENWKKFRETGPKNVVTPERWYSQDHPESAKAKAAGSKPPIIGFMCFFAQKLMFNEEIKAQIRALPSYRPNAYWAAKNTLEYQSIREIIGETAVRLRLHTEYGDPSPPDRYTGFRGPGGGGGASSRKGPSSLRANREPWHRELIPSVYPVRSGFMSADLPNDPIELEEKLKNYATNPMHMIELDAGRNRGFGYCYQTGNFWTPETKSVLVKMDQFVGFMTVDGQRVSNPDPGNYKSNDNQETIAFADEYLLRTHFLYLDSYEGGV